MTAADAVGVAAVLSERTYNAGDDIEFRPTGDSVYIVKAGRVRLESGNIAVAILGHGQLFGTSSLCGTATTNQRAVAMEDVILCEAPAGKFLAAMSSHPLLATRVAQLLAGQLDALQRSVQRAAEDSVERRLASLVLQLAESDSARQVRGLAQADLARLIGASRESVSRLMAQWEREGLVRARHRALEVVNEAGLRTRVAHDIASSS